ncbi:PH domain-containing protein [Luteipulveratus halotolerans]|uniref:PH domain-containing protein n=1 Tax=Luteipulveratus halotolerans TaxID=1631356 RepID=UPI000680849D|nr:PH domain-containing protein [Luteipulveratus halotolerans]
MDGVNRRAVERLAPYRLPKEKVVVAMQEHWAARVEPVATTIFGFFLVITIGTIAPARMGLLTNAAWWLWFVLAIRMAWVMVNWHFSWFVATDKRLLLLYGIITRKVAMMPMARVTDMSYTRSPLGRVLGYGTFVLESAGQDQALSTIHWVRDPDETYRLICSQIFGGFDPAEDGPEAAGGKPGTPGNGGPTRGPGGPGGSGGPDRPGGAPDPTLVRDRPAPEADEEVEVTDVPIHHLGRYLENDDERTPLRDRIRTPWHRRHQSRVSPRVVRRARDHDLADAESDPGWTISREDVSPHHSVGHTD